MDVAIGIALVPVALALWVGAMFGVFVYVVPAAERAANVARHALRLDRLTASKVGRLLNDVAWGD